MQLSWVTHAAAWISRLGQYTCCYLLQYVQGTHAVDCSCVSCFHALVDSRSDRRHADHAACSHPTPQLWLCGTGKTTRTCHTRHVTVHQCADPARGFQVCCMHLNPNV